MVQRKDDASHQVEAVSVVYFRPVAVVSADPHGPSGAISYNRAIDARPKGPLATQVVISVSVKRAIGQRHDETSMVVLV